MSVNIIKNHLKVGTHLSDHIISEIESTVNHHIDGRIDATVTLTKNTQQNYVHADIQVHVGNQFLAHCIGCGHNVKHSIVMGIEKLKEQLRRPKTHAIDMKSQMCDHEHHDGFRSAH